MTPAFSGRFGPLALERGYRLRLYAPAAARVDAQIDGRSLTMTRDGDWFSVDAEHAKPGSRYAFAVDGGAPIPDPASRFQPDGVHAASQIVAPRAARDDGWRGRPWHEHVMYELHVGTFTFEGTYEAAGHRLHDLVALGITAIELMPIAAFPGARNWGYDGVMLYAPFAGYGSPGDLQRFVAHAHALGLAVMLDVVYNHFGPEGNYLHGLAPTFFNDKEHTPWGAAIDVTRPDVRAFFAENAAYWLSEYGFDGLRLDATNQIIDVKKPDFLACVSATARAACDPRRHIALVLENDDNDEALLDAGYDAQWNDDVHHCAHVIATGESGGYYRDYTADPVGLLARSLTSGFAYQGEPSEHRGGIARGTPSAHFALTKFVSFLQNHDQTGNRAFGERLGQLALPDALRALTALVFLAPSPPMLFMGEEWAASTPFLFFCDFEPDLAKRVTEGRRREFASFPQFADPAVRRTIPDPNAVNTFEASRLRWEERSSPQHAAALAFTTSVLQARHTYVIPVIAGVTGSGASFERIGTSGIAMRWALADGMLHADANLSPDRTDGFAERLTGETFFSTHGETHSDGYAPRLGGSLVANVKIEAVPTSTYRIQFGPQFRFDDGTAIVPYLDALGIGQLYGSPYFRARPGSTHGYDVVDHTRFNPEIGTEDEHRVMIDALHERGMGHLVDFVPNHMGIGTDNPWWFDILTWGQLSPYSHFFDIDWHKGSIGRGKVVLPVLGDHYGAVVERGELTVGYDAAGEALTLNYFDKKYPLTPAGYGMIIEFAAHAAPPETASLLRDLGRSFAALRGKPRDAVRRIAMRDFVLAFRRELSGRMRDDPSFARALSEGCSAFAADPNRLDELVAVQHYRLAYWRVSSDEINYRRFFDINDLAGLRVEDAEVLARTHELVFAMIADGRIQGLRIDHIDGLYNPAGYAQLLADRSVALGQPLYLVVEKILLGEERLRPSWRIAGTTGYDFMNDVAGLFVDSQAERGFDRIYRRVIGRSTTFADEAYEAKKRVMRIDLASELSVLIDALVRIAHTDRRSRDFTSNALRRALIEVFALFPVYRTYVVDESLEDEDRDVINAAVDAARARAEFPDNAVFDFVRDALSAQLVERSEAGYDRKEVLRFAMRAQQYTGPVTAKSLEDTSFYRYVRLAALNEVGGEPARFGRSVDEFHANNQDRASTHPHAMLATATHDHKRGEDTRIRIAALTEFPPEWSRAVGRWARMNAAFHTANGTPAPVDEFLFYQTVVGTLPPEWLGDGDIAPAELDAYADRLVAYAHKAAREAKLRTSWTDRSPAYEDGLETFIRAALSNGTPFLRDARAFTAQLAPLAAVHSLAQTALKLTAPGVPDIYQGCELWDFSLVDPDNRRPVDYDARRAMLAAFAAGDVPIDALLDGWHDGRIKLFVTWKLLQLRRERRSAFLDGGYRALAVSGPDAASIVAFAREDIIVATPRLARRRMHGGARVRFGAERIDTGYPGGRFVSVFDGRSTTADSEGTVAASELFATFPVAVLVPEAS